VPLYRRVSDDLLRAIAARGLGPGAALPSEGELCRAYGVSRITIRKALDELAARQVITRRRGAGTFISDPARQAKSVKLTGVLEDVLMLNRMQVVSDGWARLPDHLAAFAELDTTEPLRRVVGVNHLEPGAPVVHIAFWFPPGPAAMVTADEIAGPLPTIRLIERRHPVRLDHASQRMDAVAAPAPVAEALDIRRGTPVLRALRAYRDAEGATMELFEAHYHPDRYDFTATLFPRQG
jgi:GntR family transcriptional regulator